MTDRVTCGECHHTYDSDENAFCPRCGAMERAKDPGRAVDLANRRDPRRRSIQAAGIMMIGLGGVSMLLFIGSLMLAPTLVPETLDTVADQPGGDLHVRTLNGTQPMQANVTILALNGTVLDQASTDAAGWANFTMVDHAGVQVRAETDDGNWTARILTISGVDGSAAELTMDLSGPPGDDPEWRGISGFVTTSRVLAGVSAAVAAITVAGGVAALRLRGRQWAIMGAALAVVPTLTLTLVSIGFIVFPVLFGWATYTFLRSRDLFAS